MNNIIRNEKIPCSVFNRINVFSCQRRQDAFSAQMIQKLSTIEDEIPSVYNSLDLFIMINDSMIVQRSINDLFRNYKENYSEEFKSFDVFLDEVLNKDFKLSRKTNDKLLYLDGFTLNMHIKKEYDKIGFENFLKKYSKNGSRNDIELELNKASIKEEEYLSIAYLLYKNRYDIAKDCYLGKDYIVMREERFK